MKDFDAEFKRSQRTFNVFFWIVVVIQILAVIAVATFITLALHEASSLDWSHGLSGVVDKLWCGPKGCK